MSLTAWLLALGLCAIAVVLYFLVANLIRGFWANFDLRRHQIPLYAAVFGVTAGLLILFLYQKESEDFPSSSIPPFSSSPPLSSPPLESEPAPAPAPPPAHGPAPAPPPAMGPDSVRNWLFPWPPPTPSAFTRLSLERLGVRPVVRGDYRIVFGDIDWALQKALEKAGHAELSYYGVPRGFAMVTRLESIQGDGSPKPGTLRWDINAANNRPFSLASYIEALFTAPPGRYRVIVFVFTPEAFSFNKIPVTRGMAEDWLLNGANTLPPAIFFSRIDPDTLCTALIYEFQKDSPTSEAQLRRPSSISAAAHIIGTGLKKVMQ